MKTWNDYKEHVKAVDPVIAKDIEEVESISSIISAMVEQRTAMGLSQRELAAMCGIHNPPLPGLNPVKQHPIWGHSLIFFNILVYN